MISSNALAAGVKKWHNEVEGSLSWSMRMLGLLMLEKM
jgi:hypothetical protein